MFMVLNQGIYSFLLAVTVVFGFYELDEAVMAFGQFMFLSGLSSISNHLLNSVTMSNKCSTAFSPENFDNYPRRFSIVSSFKCEMVQV